ncbi:MAG: competence protein [Alteromonadaceae bacterium]|nr:competence protein [Alteromonadaceae bacterium]
MKLKLITLLAIAFCATSMAYTSANMPAATSLEQTIDAPISINRASIDELTKLKGIGKRKAKAIVNYREQHGDFQVIEDLLLVKGIGDKLYKSLESQITL